MALFLVVAIDDQSGTAIQAALTAKFPNNYYTLAPCRWFVSSNSPTAMDLSDALGITNAGGATVLLGIVVSIKGYYGSAPGNVWEWVAAKVERANG
jgi:hypothetical protein